jgi:hypothetical protein
MARSLFVLNQIPSFNLVAQRLLYYTETTVEYRAGLEIRLEASQ